MDEFRRYMENAARMYEGELPNFILTVKCGMVTNVIDVLIAMDLAAHCMLGIKEGIKKEILQ